MKVTSCICLLFTLYLFACNDKKSSLLKKNLNTEIKNKVTENKIKFLLKNNHIIIPLIFRDSIKANFILDTGAYGFYLDSAFVKNKGIIPEEYYASPNTFAGRGKYIRGINKVHQESMPILIKNITDTLTFKPILINLRGILGSDKADGMLGMDFMEKYVMEINYDENYLIFHKSKTYKKPDNLKSIPMRYEAKGNRYYIDTDFKITDSISVRQNAIIDLGAGSSGITFCTYVVKKNNLMTVIKEKKPYKIKGKTITGGDFNGYLAKIKSVSFHGMVIDTPRVRLFSTERGHFSGNMILMGNYIFSKYERVVFDFGRGRIYIAGI